MDTLTPTFRGGTAKISSALSCYCNFHLTCKPQRGVLRRKDKCPKRQSCFIDFTLNWKYIRVRKKQKYQTRTKSSQIPCRPLGLSCQDFSCVGCSYTCYGLNWISSSLVLHRQSSHGRAHGALCGCSSCPPHISPGCAMPMDDEDLLLRRVDVQPLVIQSGSGFFCLIFLCHSRCPEGKASLSCGMYRDPFRDPCHLEKNPDYILPNSHSTFFRRTWCFPANPGN